MNVPPALRPLSTVKVLLTPNNASELCLEETKVITAIFILRIVYHNRQVSHVDRISTPGKG